MYSTIKAGWFFAALSVCMTSVVLAGCPRCVKIEADRAKEQAENPQVVGYYDQHLSLAATNDVAENSPSATSRDTLTTKDVFEENDVKLPAYRNEDASKVPKASDKEEDKFPEIGNPHTGNLAANAIASGAASSTIHNILDTKDFLSSLAGSFTLFIPSDKALSELPPGFLQNLLKPENADRLRILVSNHVVPKQILKSDFVKFKGLEVKTLGGRNLTLNSDSRGLTIDDARLLSIEPAGNAGTIYVIDRVLL